MSYPCGPNVFSEKRGLSARQSVQRPQRELKSQILVKIENLKIWNSGPFFALNFQKKYFEAIFTGAFPYDTPYWKFRIIHVVQMSHLRKWVFPRVNPSRDPSEN